MSGGGHRPLFARWRRAALRAFGLAAAFLCLGAAGAQASSITLACKAIAGGRPDDRVFKPLDSQPLAVFYWDNDKSLLRIRSEKEGETVRYSDADFMVISGGGGLAEKRIMLGLEDGSSFLWELDKAQVTVLYAKSGKPVSAVAYRCIYAGSDEERPQRPKAGRRGK